MPPVRKLHDLGPLVAVQGVDAVVAAAGEDQLVRQGRPRRRTAATASRPRMSRRPRPSSSRRPGPGCSWCRRRGGRRPPPPPRRPGRSARRSCCSLPEFRSMTCRVLSQPAAKVCGRRPARASPCTGPPATLNFHSSLPSFMRQAVEVLVARRRTARSRRRSSPRSDLAVGLVGPELLAPWPRRRSGTRRRRRRRRRSRRGTLAGALMGPALYLPLRLAVGQAKGVEVLVQSSRRRPCRRRWRRCPRWSPWSRKSRGLRADRAVSVPSTPVCERVAAEQRPVGGGQGTGTSHRGSAGTTNGRHGRIGSSHGPHV